MNTINYVKEGDVGVLTIQQARLLDDASLQTVQREIIDLLGKATEGKIALNFKPVEFVSSAGLGMLIRIKKRCAEGSKSLRLCGIEPTIYETICITGLDQLFEIDDELPQTLVAFGAD